MRQCLIFVSSSRVVYIVGHWIFLGGALEVTFLTSFQVILVLPAQRSHKSKNNFGKSKCLTLTLNPGLVPFLEGNLNFWMRPRMYLFALGTS